MWIPIMVDSSEACLFGHHCIPSLVASFIFSFLLIYFLVNVIQDIKVFIENVKRELDKDE